MNIWGSVLWLMFRRKIVLLAEFVTSRSKWIRELAAESKNKSLWQSSGTPLIRSDHLCWLAGVCADAGPHRRSRLEWGVPSKSVASDGLAGSMRPVTNSRVMWC